METSRRRKVLSFTHHREVAALPPAEANLLLDEADRKAPAARAKEPILRGPPDTPTAS
jgi:hypothetical protein